MQFCNCFVSGIHLDLLFWSTYLRMLMKNDATGVTINCSSKLYENNSVRYCRVVPCSMLKASPLRPIPACKTPLLFRERGSPALLPSVSDSQPHPLFTPHIVTYCHPLPSLLQWQSRVCFNAPIILNSFPYSQ